MVVIVCPFVCCMAGKKSNVVVVLMRANDSQSPRNQQQPFESMSELSCAYRHTHKLTRARVRTNHRSPHALGPARLLIPVTKYIKTTHTHTPKMNTSKGDHVPRTWTSTRPALTVPDPDQSTIWRHSPPPPPCNTSATTMELGP